MRDLHAIYSTWAMLGEVETVIGLYQGDILEKFRGAAEQSHRRQDKSRLTAHAFRMTLVVQGNKLPQIIHAIRPLVLEFPKIARVRLGKW